MSRTRTEVVLLFAVGLTVLNAQQYRISTYAGGAPANPAAAVSIATDPAGNLYFVDGNGTGGLSGAIAVSHSVFKIDPAGAVTRIAGNSRTGFSGDGAAATSASLFAPRGVAADRAGNVFIADTGNQRIRRVTPDGIITTVAGGGSELGDDGPATNALLNYPGSVVLDSAGNLFIGELGRVRKVSRDGIITTVAGGGTHTSSDGGPATSAQLSGALDVAVDGAGNLFIVERPYNEDTEGYDYRVRKVSPAGIVSTLMLVPACCGVSITADAAGNLFISSRQVVWKISAAGERTVVAGNGNYGPPSGDGEAAIRAQLGVVTALAVDAAQNLLIADDLGRKVRRVTPDGIIRSVASIPTSTPIASGDGGPAVNAQLRLAVAGLIGQGGLATDSEGNLYIAETGAHRIRRVSPSGTITTVAGVGTPRCLAATCLPLGDGGPAIGAALWYPTSVAVDRAGNLFIADTANLRVRKVSPDGIITTVAGNGIAPASRDVNDGVPADQTSLTPRGVAVDDRDNLLLWEGFSAQVRKVSPDGTISTIPTANAAFLGFNPSTAMTVDRAGNLFIAGYTCIDEYCSLTMRKFSPDGVITLVAARSPHSIPYGADDGGPAISAQLGYISSLAVDPAGNLFFTDLHAQRIRKIDLNGIITTVGGNGIPSYSGDGGPAAKATLNYPLGLAIDAAGNIYSSDFNQAVRVLRPEVQK